MVLEENEEQLDIHSQVQPLIKEFEEMILEDIPPDLLPIRDIQH